MVALMEVVLLFSSLFLIIFVFFFSFYFNMELQTEKVVIGLG